jgi:Ser/Thr protein kinase RdoA (MazF antagonist)
MHGPNFDGEQLRGTPDRMLKETLDITYRCEGVYQSLPIQLIHGDLHYDNVLVLDGKVTALLDFESTSFDWRAMELAICLSKYAGEEEPDAMFYFDDFINGFAKHGKLTKAEATAVPSHPFVWTSWALPLLWRGTPDFNMLSIMFFNISILNITLLSPLV